MKAVKIVLAFCFGLAFLTGCGLKQTGQTTSRVSEFVVWNGDIYEVTSEKVNNVGKEIGEVTKFSDTEGTYTGNFSNVFPVGTKYYEIQGVDTKISIAVKTPDGSYAKADDRGQYGQK